MGQNQNSKLRNAQSRQGEPSDAKPKLKRKEYEEQIAGYRRWYDYSRARDAMFAATDTPESPWYVVKADENGVRD